MGEIVRVYPGPVDGCCPFCDAPAQSCEHYVSHSIVRHDDGWYAIADHRGRALMRNGPHATRDEALQVSRATVAAVVASSPDRFFPKQMEGPMTPDEIEKQLDRMPFTMPVPLGRFDPAMCGGAGAVEQVGSLTLSAARVLFALEGAVELNFQVFCQRNVMTGVREPLVWGVKLKPHVPMDVANKEALALAVGAICRRGEALAVVTMSEAWVAAVDKMPERVSSLEHLPGRRDMVVVTVELAHAQQMFAAEILGRKPGLLGPMEAFEQRLAEGRFTRLLRAVMN